MTSAYAAAAAVASRVAASLPVWGWACAGAAALVAYVLLQAWRALTSPPPAGGTPYTLPNGLRIQHWQASETDFLFTEIWGAESAYSARGGIIFRPGAVILDAGANIGMFSLYAASACRGSARVVSFEPIPSTHAVLAANARAAAAGEYAAVLGGRAGQLKMEALNVGLASARADATFEHHPHFSVWSTSDAGFAEARLARITEDMPRALDSDKSACVRACFPRPLARALAALVLRGKMGKTQQVPVRLVTLSSVIDERDVGPVIDLLKVDVEGAELDVLKGIRNEHWPRIQQVRTIVGFGVGVLKADATSPIPQVALEVESFAIKDEVCAILKRRGFETSWFASERERNPGVLSEVSMVYGIRPAYRDAHKGGRGASPAAVKGGRSGAVAAPKRSASPAALSTGKGKGRSASRLRK